MKNNIKLNFNFALSFLLLLVLVINGGCSSAIEIQSHTRTSEVKIDGDNSDWQGPYYNLEEQETGVKFMNDDKYLYICMVGRNKQKAFQILSNGLTVWFDKDGGKEEIFGIHFPIGMEPGMMIDPMKRNDKNTENEDIEKNREEIFDMMKESLREMEILGPGKNDVDRNPAGKVPGISLGLRNTDRVLVYELKVPLRKDKNNPYAIEADTSKYFTVGIKSGKSKMGMQRGRMQEGGMGQNPPGGGNTPPGGGTGAPPGGGGMGRGGRSGGGGMGPMGSGNRPDQMKELEVWFKVALVK